jgi:hypothetical protein
MKRLALLLFVSYFLSASQIRADSLPTAIDFENLSDSTVIGASYAADGVIFSNAVVATAGISLNDADFPPHSGVNVAIDGFGPITLTFTTPISSFSAFFTYASGLTLTAFNSADQAVASAQSLLRDNFVSSGNIPNELIQLNSVGGIDRVTIAGDPNGGSFAFDDVTFIQTSSTPLPEPTTLSLLVTALLCGIISRRIYNPKS